MKTFSMIVDASRDRYEACAHMAARPVQIEYVFAELNGQAVLQALPYFLA